jgi:hypothetical protein
MTPYQKIDSFYFRHLPLYVMAIGMTVMLVRLTMMQTEGLLGFGGAFVTATFAFTSLLYARARATANNDEITVRAQIADESLRLSMLAFMGFVVTAFSFLALSENYLPRTGHVLGGGENGPELAPEITAFVCTLLFGVPILVKMKLVIEMTVKDMGLSES